MDRILILIRDIQGLIKNCVSKYNIKYNTFGWSGIYYIVYTSKIFFISFRDISFLFHYLLSVCLSVCPCVSNKLQNGWTDRVQILCGTSHDLRKGLKIFGFFSGNGNFGKKNPPKFVNDFKWPTDQQFKAKRKGDAKRPKSLI